MLLLLARALHAAPPRQITVAPVGKADFRTVQAAINSLPAKGPLPVAFSKNDIYREKVTIDGRPGPVLRGQREAGVVLTISQANGAFRCDPANAGR
ncbi:MAG: hypothetical protein EOO56_02285 [Hymenobacter sp.]|nr:MAG: hypothetical protein EOO56_02285 [Hymenobacter sp.]